MTKFGKSFTVAALVLALAGTAATASSLNAGDGSYQIANMAPPEPEAQPAPAPPTEPATPAEAGPADPVAEPVPEASPPADAAPPPEETAPVSDQAAPSGGMSSGIIIAIAVAFAAGLGAFWFMRRK